MTTTEVTKFNDSDLDIGIISDVLDDAPVLARMAARSVAGYTYKYLKKTANPTVGFRAENDGRDLSLGTYSTVSVTLSILDATFGVDVAVAQSDERGWAAMLGTQAIDHLRAAMAKAEDELINGDNTSGFNALADELNALSDGTVVDAGGTTASTGSSLYLVRSGLSDVHVVWGQEGVIDVGETSIQKFAGSSAGSYPAYYTPVTAWCGLQVGGAYSAGRIANITEDSGKGLTDALISSAIAKFPAGRGPSFMFCSRRSLQQLQASRTATNPTGSPAPFPDQAFGIPIVVTDNVSDVEALVS
jgi:hypothetical protein